MSCIKTYPVTPLRTHRLRTEYLSTHDRSKLADSTAISTARQPVQPTGSYLDISISKTKISQKQGYLSRKKREEHSVSVNKNEKKKIFVFKNLHEFQSQLKTQKGRFDRQQTCLDSFGVATYRGTKKSINSHHLGAHIGELTSLTLIQGYDGLFAASELKKYYHNELLLNRKGRNNKDREEPFQVTETNIRKAVQNSAKHLKKVQEQRGDNSGASFLSLVVHNDIIFVVNCGSSEALCMTQQGRMLRLAKAHTTSNQEEVDRIVKEGGQLYRTVINLPYKKQMKMTGPLRVHPEGLTVTRTMGKSLSPSKNRKLSTVTGTMVIPKGILSIPQYHYIPSSEVRWVILLSSKIIESVQSARIRDIIEQQLSKRSSNYNQQQAAEHACKRVILEGVESGVTESLSALLLLGKVSQPTAENPKRESEQPMITVTPIKQKEREKLQRQPISLKYIGHRPHFAEVLTQV